MGRRMRPATEQESKDMLKNLVFVSIISADNFNYSEDVKQQILNRYKKSNDWNYILEPLGNDMYRYLDILKAE